MIRKLAAVALLGSIGLLAASRIHDLRDLWDRKFETDHVVKIVHRNHDRGAVHQVRRSDDLRLEDVAGAYEFKESGDIFGRFPWDAHVVLTLKPTGRYILDLDITVDGDHEVETAEGDYRVENDRVILLSSDEEAHGRLEKHELRFDNGQLIADVGWPARAALGAVGVNELAFVRLK